MRLVANGIAQMLQISNHSIFRSLHILLLPLSHRVRGRVVEPIALERYQQEGGEDGQHPYIFYSLVHTFNLVFESLGKTSMMLII